MTTLTTARIVTTDTSRPSMPTLIGVQLRSLFTTRGLVATFGAAALLAGATGGGQTLREGTSTFGDVTAMALFTAPYFLLAFGAVLVVSEYTHRTAVGTFALVPHRGRVLAAKAGAVVVLSLVAAALGLVAAAMIGAVAPLLGLAPIEWSVDVAQFGLTTLGLLSAGLIGWSMGMATGSVAITLAAYLIWPMVSALIGSFSEQATAVLDWIRPDALMGLSSGVTAISLGQTAVSLTCWIVVPTVIGLVRLTKGEVR